MFPYSSRGSGIIERTPSTARISSVERGLFSAKPKLISVSEPVRVFIIRLD